VVPNDLLGVVWSVHETWTQKIFDEVSGKKKDLTILAALAACFLSNVQEWRLTRILFIC